jgi:hypothetical protein
MSTELDRLKAELVEVEQRLKEATEAHNKARDTFSRFEGTAGTPLWCKLRDEVDHTLTHRRVFKVIWHRISADILEQLNKEHGQ